MPKLLNYEELSIDIMVLTHSYKTAQPEFLLEEILVATDAKISINSSEISSSFSPIYLKNLIIDTYKNGSNIPDISNSAE